MRSGGFVKPVLSLWQRCGGTKALYQIPHKPQTRNTTYEVRMTTRFAGELDVPVRVGMAGMALCFIEIARNYYLFSVAAATHHHWHGVGG